MSRNVKKRHWTIIVYPDSAPADWREQLSDTGLAWACSPLHDMDKNPTGEPKKPHFHLILSYDGPTTYNNVKTLADGLNQPIPKPLESVLGMYRYFTHRDNPEKYQYNEADITCYNGFDPATFVVITEADKLRMTTQITDYIRDCKIYEYCDLIDFLKDNEMWELFMFASKNTLFFNRYVTGRRHKLQNAEHNLSAAEVEAKALAIREKNQELERRLNSEQLAPLSQAAEDPQLPAAHVVDEPF